MTTQTYDYYITPEDYKIAAQNGITANALNQRIRALAWPKQRAITEPTEPREKLPKEWIRTAKQNGIKYSTFRKRVKLLGWALERAATEPLCDIEKQRQYAKAASEANQKYSAEVIDLARQNGISYSTFHSRVTRLGWSIKAAATIPVMSKTDKEKELCANSL